MFRAAPLAPQSKQTRRISSGRAEVASPPDLRKLPEAALPRLERQGPASFVASNQPSNEGDPVIPGGEGVLSGRPDSEPSVGPRAGAWPPASEPPRIKLTVSPGVAWFVQAGKRPLSVCGPWGASALPPCTREAATPPSLGRMCGLRKCGRHRPVPRKRCSASQQQRKTLSAWRLASVWSAPDSGARVAFISG